MNTPIKEATVCIGSNCGDRTGNVALALVWLASRLDDFRHSPIYATPDCFGGEREYLNAVCSGKTALGEDELDRLFKEYELECGRNAAARARGDVPVDIDLVAYGGRVIREKDFASEFFLLGYRSLSR